MTILDTNVISALMQTEPDPRVTRWLDRQPNSSVWTTSITIFEVRYGLALLPEGRKRRNLEQAFDRTLTTTLGDRALDFDSPSAVAAASLAARYHAIGKNVDDRDLYIAGIVISRRATLATRNTRHFDDIDARIVNPWTDED